MKLSFYTGVGTVTGANYLLDTNGVRILVDCGMIQGEKFAVDLNRDPFLYDPTSVQFLLVTHAHIDHVGRIGKLVKDGFKGTILSTPETKALAELLMEDAVHLLENEAKNSGVLPIYDLDDVKRALTMWQTVEYHTPHEITPEIKLYIWDAGHILGSAMHEITTEGKKIVFTGDMGNSPSPLLKDTEWITDADYVVMESVYGDRNHEPKELRTAKLKAVIEETIQKKKTLLIPAFSLERTQVILYEMNELFENHVIKQMIPVFIDSPLASKITEVYKEYSKNFNDKIKADMKGGDDVFHFPRLKFTVEKKESQAIQHVPNPKIIIAGSGMSTGGRIVAHEAHYASNPNATILMVGYQTPGSLGRKLQEGAKEVIIYGQNIEVRAKVDFIAGYSSHKDSDHLVEWVGKAAESGRLKKVFCVMGEPKSAMFLAQRVNDEIKGGLAEFPQTNIEYDL